MTTGSLRNVRETETFCWLPPERNSTGCSSDGVRTSSRATRSFTARRSDRLRRKPSLVKRRSDWMVEFTRTPSTGISASCLRSPGRSMTPDRTAWWVEIKLSSRSSHTTLPARGGVLPARQSNSWDCPFPSAPAIPTTSPLSRVKLTGPND